MRYVAAYCRQACALGSAPLSGVRTQERTIRRYAVRRKVRINEVYLDPGESGASLDRPGLQKLLADCRAGKVETVLMTDLDRLSRREDRLLLILRLFVREGVNIEVCMRGGREPFAFRLMAWGAAAKYAKSLKPSGSNKARRSKRT